MIYFNYDVLFSFKVKMTENKSNQEETKKMESDNEFLNFDEDNENNDQIQDSEDISIWELMSQKKIKEMANTNLRIKDMLDDDLIKKIQNQTFKNK